MDKKYSSVAVAVIVIIFCYYFLKIGTGFVVAFGLISGIVAYFVLDALELKSYGTEKKAASKHECWEDFLASPEKKSIENRLGRVLRSETLDTCFSKLVGYSWFIFLDTRYGMYNILELSAVSEPKNRFRGFVSERELMRLSDLKELESLTREGKIDLGVLKELREAYGDKGTLKEVIEK